MSEPREINVLSLSTDAEEALYDFRPKPVDADAPEPESIEEEVPKDSSAAESADSSTSETKTPANDSAQDPEKTVSVEKDSGQPKE